MKKSPATPHWWDWSAIALLFLLLEILATRLVNTSWTPFLYLIQAFTSIGLIIGALLGYSRFHRRTARWLSFLYMLVILPLQWTLVIDQRVSLEEQLVSVWGRLVVSVSELIARHPVKDPFFFVAVMSVAFWIISASAGFSLTRYQNYLRAVIPSAIGILVIQHYDNTIPGRMWILAFFIFIALLLLGRLYYLQNQSSWHVRRVFISAENNIDLISGMTILAVLIIFTSFIVPASRSDIESAQKTWNRITRPWNDFTQKLDNAVSALESPSSGGGSSTEFYGTELSLGRGFPLSESIMFSVEVPEESYTDAPPRYYWRGRTYDHYVAGQWYTTSTTREEFSPENSSPPVTDTQGRTPHQFVIRVGAALSLLYAPSQPVWFSRPGSFLAAPAGEDKDIVSWNATPSLLPGETYEVQAVLKNPNVQELREAGTNYPEWVVDKYLQTPESFSPRIIDLAEEITANTDTPYDKAAAITRFLRETIKYAQTIPLPPEGQDPLEWVLFEHKEAYCVYYATSEVLMLRSLGIPARMAVGFAEGTISTTSRNRTEEGNFYTYTIRRQNAHAWPEVYFPGIGWIEFEPTGGQASLERPLPLSELDANNIPGPAIDPRLEDGADSAVRNQSDEGTNQTLLQTLAVNPSLYVVPLFLALAALAVFLGRRYNIPARVPVFIRTSIERSGAKAPNWVIHWERWTTLSPIEKAFESINFGLRQLKQPAPIHSTPSERANALSLLIPQLADQIKVLLDEHQTSLYTSRTADVNQAQHTAQKIRLQIILARLRRFLTGTYAIHS